MTVSSNKSTTTYTADGVSTYYEFGFPYIPGATTVIVTVDDEIVNYTVQNEGVLFDVPPLFGATIVIYRVTVLDQSADFRVFGPFEAEKTEGALDRLILMKGEGEFRGRLNLISRPDIGGVELFNSQGTNPYIQLWNNGRAGAFSGTVLKSLPINSSLTNTPEFYVWMAEETVPGGQPPSGNARATSLLYAYLTDDAVDSAPDIEDLSVRTWEPQEVDSTPGVDSIVLLKTIDFKTVPPTGEEEVDSTPGVAEITLEQVIDFKTASPIEEVDSAPDVDTVTLTTVIEFQTVAYNEPVDSAPGVDAITLTTP